MTSSRLLARRSSAASVAAAVAVASGLLLDVVVVTGLGAGRESDAFVVAARLPLGVTAVLIFLGTQVLVPTLAAWTTSLGPRRVHGLVWGLVVLVLAAGSALAGALALLSPLLVAVLGAGFDAETQELATSLSRVMVWTVPLAAAAEVPRAYLNASGRVVVPAGMTVVLNIVATSLVLLWTGEVSSVPTAYVAGSAVQLTVVLGYAVARGLRPARPVLRAEEISALHRLAVLPVVGAGLNPVARAAETMVASFLAPGSVTVVHVGHRLVSAVGGTVLFRSVLVAVLPPMTRAVVAGHEKEARRLGDLGLRLLMRMALPLTGLAVVLAVPVAGLVFDRGRFDAPASTHLGWFVAVLALSLPLSAMQRAWLAPWYARRETRVPLDNTALGVGAGIVLLPVGVVIWSSLGSDAAPTVGLAIAYVGANVVNVVHARRALLRGGLPVPRLASGEAWRLFVAATAGAAAASAVVLWEPLGAWGSTLVAGTCGLTAVACTQVVVRPRRRHRAPVARIAPAAGKVDR